MESEIIKCPICSEEIKKDAKKCRYCGEWINYLTDTSSSEDRYTEGYELICEPEEANLDELNHFIGDKADFYIESWEVLARSNKNIRWSWASATGILWLGYRKMYSYAFTLLLVILAVDIIELSLGLDWKIGIIIFLLTFIGIGLFGPYLYGRFTQKTIAETRTEPSPLRNKLLQKNGGISKAGAVMVFAAAVVLTVLPPIAVKGIGSINSQRSIGSNPLNNTPVADKNAVFGVQDFDRLFPGWLLMSEEVFSIDNQNYCVVGMGRIVEDEDEDDSASIRISLCEKTDKSWTEVWRIPEDLSSDYSDADYLRKNPKLFLQDLVVTTNNNTALIAANVLVGGTHGTTQVLAFTFNQKEKGIVRMLDSSGIMSVKKDGETILVTGEDEFGIHKLLLENGSFKQEHITLSSMTPVNSVEARFIIGGYDSIAYPVAEKAVKLKVGQSIAFVPGDEKTRKLFDEGSIMIYSDAWNGPPLSLSEANRIKTGNSYRFDKAGSFNFFLQYSSSDSDEEKDSNSNTVPAPTFTALVEP